MQLRSWEFASLALNFEIDSDEYNHLWINIRFITFRIIFREAWQKWYSFVWILCNTYQLWQIRWKWDRIKVSCRKWIFKEFKLKRKLLDIGISALQVAFSTMHVSIGEHLSMKYANVLSGQKCYRLLFDNKSISGSFKF